MLSRRAFVLLTGATVLISKLPWAKEKSSVGLDHLLFGCNDLDAGIHFVEQHTGVRAALGGVHPGMGTRNALLSLGDRQYLEIIAPDPNQTSVEPFAAERWNLLKGLQSPRLVNWAAHVDDMAQLADRLRKSGLEFDGPHPGSRNRPDGRTLRWKTLELQDDMRGLLPFFIEWSADSVHPSIDAPRGCHLQSFSIEDRDPHALRQIFQQLGIAVNVHEGAKPRLVARIKGPKGLMQITS